MKDFLIIFSDGDQKIWSLEQVRCMSDDDDQGLRGKWQSASNSDDVFGPGTGNHGWYTWRPTPGMLFLNRPGAPFQGLENSLIRFFDVHGFQHTIGNGLAFRPPPPARDGERIDITYELAIHEHLDH
jgi:hypothetical protein